MTQFASMTLLALMDFRLLKTTIHKKHGADRICFKHHPNSVICSSKHNLESTSESLWYLLMDDNRCLRYFKGHKERVVSLCMSPINDSFMSGSLDHSVRDLHVNACQFSKGKKKKKRELKKAVLVIPLALEKLKART